MMMTEETARESTQQAMTATACRSIIADLTDCSQGIDVDLRLLGQATIQELE